MEHIGKMSPKKLGKNMQDLSHYVSLVGSSQPSKISTLQLLDLPNEVLISILRMLPYSQLLVLKKVSKHFLKLIEQELPALIKRTVMHNTFLREGNMKLFCWLSSQGNFEATLKLSLGHLYSDGLNHGKRYREENSQKAGKFFVEMEQKVDAPLTWIFIRPPWSTATVCCKAHVLDYFIKVVKEGNNHPHLTYCIGKVLNFFQDDETKMQSAVHWLQESAKGGLPDALFDLWCIELRKMNDQASMESSFLVCSPDNQLYFVRKLRRIAAAGHLASEMHLCSLYAKGFHGGLSVDLAAKYVRGIFSNCEALPMNRLFEVQHDLTVIMRYILVDWLVEVVSSTRSYDQELLHAAVKCMDRYLLLRVVPKNWLQLLGITCMVICTRFMENDLLTIREAVWLTDNTYQYEELVRMMEEVVSALEGNIKQTTVYDFLTIICKLGVLSTESQNLARYISDLTLFHPEAASFSASVVASVCALLGNLASGSDIAWCEKLIQFTGFTTQDLLAATLQIHEICLMNEPLKDQRNVQLDALEERYKICSISTKRSEIISRKSVLTYFGLNEESLNTSTHPCHKTLSEPTLTQSKGNNEEDHTMATDKPDYSILKSRVLQTTGKSQEISSDEEFDNDTPTSSSNTYFGENSMIKDEVGDQEKPRYGNKSSACLRARENVPTFPQKGPDMHGKQARYSTSGNSQNKYNQIYKRRSEISSELHNSDKEEGKKSCRKQKSTIRL